MRILVDFSAPVFKLKPDSGSRWWYQAGQYTTLGLDTAEHGFVPRAYSIAGTPLDLLILQSVPRPSSWTRTATATNASRLLGQKRDTSSG